MAAGPRRLALICRTVKGLSGAAITILEHARRFSRAGWRVDVLGNQLDVAAVRAAGAAPVWIPTWPWGSYAKRWVYGQLAAWRARRRYDVVHGHGEAFACDVLSLHNCVHAAHEAVHDAPLPGSDPVGRIHAGVLRRRAFQRLIANSQQTKRDVVARHGLPEALVDVVYPAYAEDKFRLSDRERLRPEARKELGFTEGDVVFGLITSGDFVKRGVAGFIRALGRLTRLYPSVKAIVVGKERRPQAYERLAWQHGVGPALRLLPPIPDVERYYHACDVCVHPALYEEFGQTVLEAMACGLPVVVGGRVGAGELMTGELRQLVLDELSDERLAQALEALAEDAALRRRLGEGAAAAARARGWAQNVAETQAVYERLSGSVQSIA